MWEVNSCVTAKNLAKFLWKIFFPVTISLDTEQTKKFHQRFLELKASALRTSDEISSFSKLQEISPLKLSCHDFFFAKMWKFVVCFTFLQKKNHDRKVSRAISLATERTKKFHQRFIELKPSTLRTSDRISSFAQYQEKSSPSHFCKKKSWQESFKGDFSWYFENEEISSEVHRVEAFNSKTLWWNFFVLKVAREIVTGKNIFNKNFVKFLVVTQKITLHISDKKNGRFLSENMKYTSRDKKKYFHISTLVFYID